MNLTYIHLKSIENWEKNNSSVNIRFVAKTSDIKDLLPKHQTSKISLK